MKRVGKNHLKHEAHTDIMLSIALISRWMVFIKGANIQETGQREDLFMVRNSRSYNNPTTSHKLKGTPLASFHQLDQMFESSFIYLFFELHSLHTQKARI